jgi:hypothetical protein
MVKSILGIMLLYSHSSPDTYKNRTYMLLRNEKAFRALAYGKKGARFLHQADSTRR